MDKGGRAGLARSREARRERRAERQAWERASERGCGAAFRSRVSGGE